MSLLQQLQKKKQSLKETTTTVTCTDGRRYLESKGLAHEIEKKTFGFVVDEKPDKIPAKIRNNIYLGSQDCCDADVLNNYHITRVLSVGVPPPVKCDEITYKYVQCLDLPESDIGPILDECLPFIKENVRNCGVLVHCNAGVSRSPSIVIAYLMLEEGLSYEDAFNVVKTARPCIKPNSGFERQLKLLHASSFTLLV